MSYLLAELNIAKLKYGLDDPRMKDFVDNLDIVNGMAEASDGFVWRYVEDINANAADQTFPPDIIANMSVWRDVHALRAFMATEPHRPIMARRQEWFHRMDTPHLVLWPVLPDQMPTLADAKARVELLEREGPTPEAFSWAWALGTDGKICA